MEGLPGHKLDLPGEPQSMEQVMERAVAVAGRVPGLQNITEEDLQDIIMPNQEPDLDDEIQEM